jgi:hypothetical protein
LKWNIYSVHGLELSTREVQVSWHVECQKCFRDGEISGAFTEMRVRPIKKEKEKEINEQTPRWRNYSPFLLHKRFTTKRGAGHVKIKWRHAPPYLCQRVACQMPKSVVGRFA